MATRTSLMEFQIPRIVHEEAERGPRNLRDRAARPRLRLHVRELAAPRAALVARGRRRDRRQDRRRLARVHDAAGRPRGRHGHHPQPEEPGLPPARRVARDRGARRQEGRGRRHRRRHRGAGRSRDPQPGARARAPLVEGQARDDADDRPRSRLRPGRGQPRPGDDDRRDPDRLDLLARAPRRVRRRGCSRRSAHRLRQASARRDHRRLDRAAGRDRAWPPRS